MFTLNEDIYPSFYSSQWLGCLVALLTILYASAEKAVRIDWVGDEGHAQPQDPLTTIKPTKLGPVYETYERQALNVIPIDDDADDDDLQQRMQPVFGKETYIEFDEQRKLKP